MFYQNVTLVISNQLKQNKKAAGAAANKCHQQVHPGWVCTRPSAATSLAGSAARWPPHSETMAENNEIIKAVCWTCGRVALRPSKRRVRPHFPPPTPGVFLKRRPARCERGNSGRSLLTIAGTTSENTIWESFLLSFQLCGKCASNLFFETAPLHSNFPFNDPHRGVFIKSSIRCESQ